jgi:cytochrome c peroxidase
VASGTPFDTTKKFQVPSLKYVGGSAPYFHDGRYKTLEELIKASDGKMGHTGHLAESDVSDLAAFLRTL